LSNGTYEKILPLDKMLQFVIRESFFSAIRRADLSVAKVSFLVIGKGVFFVIGKREVSFQLGKKSLFNWENASLLSEFF